MPSCLKLVALVFGLHLLTPAAARQPDGLDPEPKGQTLWRVVVHTKSHPLLTPSFRAQLRRDILAALEPSVGALGTVDVIDLDETPRDKWDPMWEQLVTNGFAALETSRDLTGVKTHFLRVEYRDGAFHLESRQYDGFTGLVSPMVRRQSARAPELVGRTAGLMLDRDFGIAATVEPLPGKTDDVKLTLRGGGLGSVSRFVKVGDVFAVSQVRATKREAPPPARTATGKIIAPPPGSVPPPALTAAQYKYTLVRVTEVGKDGTCRGVALSPRPNPLGVPGVTAFRAMKLATVTAPLAVRLAGPDGRTHTQTSSLSVVATDNEFSKSPQPRDDLPFREGLFRSGKPLSNVACVVVNTGPTSFFRFPVPVTGTDPVTLNFTLDPKAEEKAVYERAVLTLAGRVAEARGAQLACFTAVAKLITEKKNGDALRRAQAGYRSAADAEKGYGEEHTQLSEQVAKSKDAGPFLSSIGQQLQALKRTNVQLMESIKQLELVVARENDPSVAGLQIQADALVTRISLLLARGDVDEAINAYEQLANLRPGDADVAARRDKLKAEWKEKSPEHAKAREYLLKSWPALATIQDLDDSLGQMRNSVELLMKSNDRHAARKFLNLISEAAVKLEGLVAPLDANSDGDSQSLKKAKVVRDVVGKAEIDLVEFLKKE